MSDSTIQAEIPKTNRHGSQPLRRAIAVHRGSRVWAAATQLIVTTFLFVFSWWCMWRSRELGFWAPLLLSVPTAGFLVRLFILQHDCGHGSMFASPKLNRLVGVLLSALTFTPYQCWRRQHAEHHATNGQLDHRGIGDVTTWTVAEYYSATPWQRLKYRLYRNPLILFGVGPVIYFAVLQRIPWLLPTTWPKERQSVMWTNVMLLVVYSAAAWWIGPWTFFSLHLPVVVLASSVGSWLFFVQHQFPDTYWQHDGTWDFARAAIEGSSFLDLPAPLRWITANIGYHHIHHLDSRIPNYSLVECHHAHQELQAARRLTLRDGLRYGKLKLWDESTQELITFAESRRRMAQRTAKAG